MKVTPFLKGTMPCGQLGLHRPSPLKCPSCSSLSKHPSSKTEEKPCLLCKAFPHSPRWGTPFPVLLQLPLRTVHPLITLWLFCLPVFLTVPTGHFLRAQTYIPRAWHLADAWHIFVKQNCEWYCELMLCDCLWLHVKNSNQTVSTTFFLLAH